VEDNYWQMLCGSIDQKKTIEKYFALSVCGTHRQAQKAQK